jgi:hypothetical protein
MIKLPDNVERSHFRPGGYNCWDGTGQLWQVERAKHCKQPCWVARPGPGHKSRWLPHVRAKTLTEVARVLKELGHEAAHSPEPADTHTSTLGGEPF